VVCCIAGAAGSDAVLTRVAGVLEVFFPFLRLPCYPYELLEKRIHGNNGSTFDQWRYDVAVERTLSIVKPDAVAKNLIGQISARFEAASLKIVAARMMHLSQAQAEGFYAVHRERPFFADLVKFMISGPVLVQVLEGESAILKNRDLMGATDPRKAAPGTIRADFAQSIDANAVHGSDSPETAAVEIAYFFPAVELHSRG
jgi:nucleoside-diphosphate kinase